MGNMFIYFGNNISYNEYEENHRREECLWNLKERKINGLKYC